MNYPGKDSCDVNTSAIADKPPSKPVEPAELTEQADPRTSISKDVDGFDYEFVKQQREVEQVLQMDTIILRNWLLPISFEPNGCKLKSLTDINLLI